MTRPPLVLLLPHPDDEFAAFAWIAHARAHGQTVHCIWITDGGWGGQPTLPRREESRTVLRAMGLQDEHLHFLGEQNALPDGELHLHIVRAYEAIATCLASIGPSLQLLIPAWEGGHQDHDATHLIGSLLARRPGVEVLQFPLYQGQGLRGPLFRVLSPLPANGATVSVPVPIRLRARFIAQCLGYRSQWKSFVGLLPLYTLKMLAPRPFKLQPLKPGRSTERPHEGPLLYERRNGPDHEDIAAAGRRLLDHAGMEPSDG